MLLFQIGEFTPIFLFKNTLSFSRISPKPGAPMIRAFFLSIFLSFSLLANQEYIQVEKHGVLHNFVPSDEHTDHFVRDIFPWWEEDTFAVFEKVKDPNKIAIDIGAWIGATTIWLSKNFHHVLAVECDTQSVDCLKKNLEASDCHNVLICDRPIAAKAEKVTFGPRFDRLNQSTSYIKESPDHETDYTIKSITLKQAIFDYLFVHEHLVDNEIGFIKCDIEGGEEEIIEDLLHLCHHRQCPLYIEFHLEWWKSRKISEIAYILQYFDYTAFKSRFDAGNGEPTNFTPTDLIDFLEKNPFGAVLFQPKPDKQACFKKKIPAVIIGFNQPTYIRNMVKQLEKYTHDIVILDNNSDSPSLLDYYENEYKYTLLSMGYNYGHWVYLHKKAKKLVGDLYLLTDPDIQLNPHLPDDFIEKLHEISNDLSAHRLGCALEIDSEDIREDIIAAGGMSIKDWESQHWIKRVDYPKDPSLEIYEAGVDTTFCLLNQKYYTDNRYRIAGDYTCKHLPWYKNFEQKLEEGELEHYQKNNNSTTWFK